MKVFRFLIVLALVVALCGVSFYACSNPAKLGRGDFFNMRKISLTAGDKEYLLQAARDMLEGRSFVKREDEHPLLFRAEKRGVFVVVPRKNENALSSFAMGDSIINALENATKLMGRLASADEIKNTRLRLDILDESFDIKSSPVYKRWRINNRPAMGIIFDTNPAIALLPEEIIQRNILDAKGRFHAKRLKAVIKDRGVGTKAMLDFKDDNAQVNWTGFSRISFIEDEGKKMMPLLNGRRVVFPVDANTLQNACISGGEYLKRAVKENGKFDYKYYPQMNRSSNSYNLLRHAGSVYSMFDLYQVTGDEALFKKAKLAMTYLIDQIDGPGPAEIANGTDFKAVFDKKSGMAKAGGSGLALVMLAKYAEVSGDRQYVPLMGELAKFIIHQTEPNGHLAPKYYKIKPRKKDNFDSLYYPGECVLGLTRLYELDGNMEWIKAGSKLVDFIVYDRDKELTPDNIPHDHWLCIAINELYPIVKNDDYKRHAYNIGEAIFRMMRKTSQNPEWVGSFYKPPRSTPSAIRNEAVIALYQMAKRSGDPTDQFYTMSTTIAKFELRMQFDDLSGMFLRHPEKARGGFMRSFEDPEIQIDYVQHNISALLGLWKIQLQKDGKNFEDYLKGKQNLEKKSEEAVKPAA